MVDPYVKRLLSQSETVLFTTRQHWFLLVQQIFLELVLIGIVTVIILLLSDISSFFYLGFILLAVPLFGLIRDILIYSSQQFLVTNRRVIHIRGIFHKTVMDSSLEKVNDVRMDQPLLGRVFDFGDVQILTASDDAINVYHFIAKPIRFKTAMLNAKEALSHLDILSDDLAGVPTRSQTINQSQESDIFRMISELDELRKRGAITEEEFERKKAELLSRI
ncbi:MAG TPA: PH domain-containing protein [Anaerolineaceae bacterium]|nr:PH domain-containing protein [Chloroflexota bacterium]HNS63141.1 PH domain-containing protein [Anaerolineaceae bacterium]HNY99873.1 PH domain-containing protein [Anaerolineaceae bacterium]HOD44766.1 PH domain-containing protein [Anaerolineaceae bacterium]HOH18804.1 PH domain-containing protein [Anaerolineaceae bacterium]